MTQSPDHAISPKSHRRAALPFRRWAAGAFSALALVAIAGLIGFAPPSAALVFASPGTEPSDEIPPDFPYWEHITQRRYDGPTVIYLGGGYALTARHVGMGEIELLGVMYEPARGSRRNLLNVNGTAADAMLFEVEREAALPDLPLLPIAAEPVMPGEDVLLIGFGRGRDKVTEFELNGRTHFGFSWSDRGAKRWGTNRIDSANEILQQSKFYTRAMSFRFDEPFAPTATRYEAHAATGDSGGAVFVQREGDWQLIGLMVSISGNSRIPKSSTLYGDTTFAADLTYYRDEILRWSRPTCSNERDDDGDGLIDFPVDPGCDSAADRNEWQAGPLESETLWLATLATFGIGCTLAYVGWSILRRQRGAITPSSMSPSSAD